MSDFEKRFPPVNPPKPLPKPPHNVTPPPVPFPHRHRKPLNHEAHFRPMLLHPHIPHHFNFWCNKVIPLIYDDSLSYYEVLAKTTDYLNNLINDVKMGAINIEELAKAFCELEHFVNDYFAWYQSKGIINYEIAINNENYEKYLPDVDFAQMNTVYRFKFVTDSEADIPDNLPESAKPYSGAECVLFNLSNFQLKRIGNEWQEITNDDKGYSTENNYQLFITDKDIYFRRNNGDHWEEWSSIFGNWWSSEFENVKQWVIDYVTPLITDLQTAIRTEVERAKAAENALDGKIEAETARATGAENALSQRLVNEYERAVAKENELEQAIEDETDRAESAEGALQTAIQNEVTRATNAEGALNTAIQNEVTRATNAEGALNTAIQNEVTRATNAESTLQTAIQNEVTRATARENELSGRIADWETDLADEREDRQQGDNALSNRINTLNTTVNNLDETVTAHGASISNNTSQIGQIWGRVYNIESGYIPNQGNTNNYSFTLERNSATIKSYSTTIRADMSSSSPATDFTVAGGVITFNTNGGANAVPAENSTLTAQRSSLKIGRGTGSTPINHIEFTNSGIQTQMYSTSSQAQSYELILYHDGTNNGSINISRWNSNLSHKGGALTISESNITLMAQRQNGTSTEIRCLLAVNHNTGTAYLFRAGENTATTDPDYQIARILDVKTSVNTAVTGLASETWVTGELRDYLPVGGNSQPNDSFILTRDNINLQGNDTEIAVDVDEIRLSVSGDHKLLADNTGITIMGGNMAELTVDDNNLVKISQAGAVICELSDGYFRIEDDESNADVLFLAYSPDQEYLSFKMFDRYAYACVQGKAGDNNTEIAALVSEIYNLNNYGYSGTIIYKDRTFSISSTGSKNLETNMAMTVVFDNCTFNWDISEELLFENSGTYIFNNCVFRGDNPVNARNIRLGNDISKVEFNNCYFSGCGIEFEEGYGDDNIITFNCCGFSVATGFIKLPISNRNVGANNIVETNIKVKFINCNNMNFVFTNDYSITSGYVSDVLITGCYLPSSYTQPPVPFCANRFYNNVISQI